MAAPQGPEERSYTSGLDHAVIEAACFDTSADAIGHLRAECHALGFVLKKSRDNEKQTKYNIATI